MWFRVRRSPSGGAGLCASMTSSCRCTRRREPVDDEIHESESGILDATEDVHGEEQAVGVAEGAEDAEAGSAPVVTAHTTGGSASGAGMVGAVGDGCENQRARGRARRRRRHPRGSVVVRGSLVGGPGTDVGESVAEDGSGASLARASAHPTRRPRAARRWTTGRRRRRQPQGGDEPASVATPLHASPNERWMPRCVVGELPRQTHATPVGPGASTARRAAREAG